MNLKDIVKNLPALEGEGTEPAVYGDAQQPNDNYPQMDTEVEQVIQVIADANDKRLADIVQSVADDAMDAKVVLTELKPFAESSDPVTQTFVQVAAESAFKMIGYQDTEINAEQINHSVRLIDKAFPKVE